MRVYLDHAATTAVDRAVLTCMTPYFCDAFGNPSSVHSFGREALSAVDEARETVAKILGAKSSEIYFTSGGSESDNWALRGVAYGNKDKGKHIVISAIEHPAVSECAESLKKEGFEITVLPVDKDGKVSLQSVQDAVREDTILVSVMSANNETGVLQPVDEIGAYCREKGIYFHTDAVQAVCSEKISVKNIDLLSLSAHKFYGPKGVGVLYVRSGVKINRLIFGGAQERGFRAGTTPVPLVVGLAKALEKTAEHLEKDAVYVRNIRDTFEKKLLERVPGCSVNGTKDRVAGISNVLFEDVDNKSLLIGLDLAGIAVSTGSACSAGDVNPSAVLLAMGLPLLSVRSSVRFSFGKENDEKEIDYVIDSILSVVNKIRGGAAAWKRMRSETTTI